MYKKASITVIIATLALTAFMASHVVQLEYNYDFEQFYPHNDPDTRFYKQYREKFGADNNFILIGLENKKGIFEESFLKKADKLTTALEDIPQINSVKSVINLKQTIRDPLLGLPTTINYLRINQPETYAYDSIRIYQTTNLVGTLVAKNGNSLALVLMHNNMPNEAESTQLTEAIKSLVKSYEFDSFHIAGKYISQSFYIKVMGGETILFMALAFFIILLILFLIYRTFWGVFLPLLTVGVSVICTMGIMQIVGKNLDIISNIIPTIMSVIGISVAIHFIDKYHDVIALGHTKEKALKLTIKQIGLAGVFTTLTTFVGFITLLTVDIIPIENFAVFSAFGVLIAYIITLLFLPAAFYLLPKPKNLSAIKKKHSWQHLLEATLRRIFKYKKQILFSFIILSIACVFGTLLIKENTRLLEGMGENKLKRDYQFFDKYYQGMRPFEMAISVKDTSKTVFSPKVLRDMAKMQNFIKAHYQIGSLLSPVTLVKGANKSLAGGNPEAFRIPKNNQRLEKITTELKSVKNKGIVRSVVMPNLQYARMRGLMSDIGSYKVQNLNDAFNIWVDTAFKQLSFNYKLTGSAMLLDKSNQNLAINIVQGLLIAIVFCAIIFAFLFRSFRILWIALLPSLLSILMIAGVMGYFDINLKMSTAILFTVAFGIAVDDTIHFITRLRIELQTQKNIKYAIKRTFLTTGKPITITSVLLVGGFLILAFSSFKGTQLMGILLSLTLFFAWANTVFLLPVLLLLFSKNKVRNKKQTAI